MTKIISLTQGKVTLVSDQDFEELNKYKWCFDGQYAQRRENTKAIRMHREIMNIPERMEIDHIDGNRLNNTRENLRVCTTQENQRNRSKGAGTSSQYKGVNWHKETGKWRAYIKVAGKQVYLGLFEIEQEAAKVYYRAAVEFGGAVANVKL